MKTCLAAARSKRTGLPPAVGSTSAAAAISSIRAAVDLESRQRMGNPHVLAQAQHPVDDAGRAMRPEPEPHRQPRHAVGDGLVVECKDIGHEHRVRHAVMGIVDRADRMGKRVNPAEPFLEGGSAHRGRRHHVPSRLDVGPVCDDTRQIFLDQAHAFDRDAFRHRMIARRAIGFEAMRESVHASACGQIGRQADGQFRIANRDRRHHPGVKDHLLGMRSRMGDDARAADFGAGSRGGRDRDDRRDARGVGARPPVPDVLEVPHRPGLSDHERDDLTDVERGPAAEGDDPVMSAGAIGGDAGFDIAVHRVGLHVAEDGGGSPGAFQIGQHLRQHRHVADAGIGDEQRLGDAGALEGVGQFGNAAGAETDRGRIVPVGFHGHCGLGS